MTTSSLESQLDHLTIDDIMDMMQVVHDNNFVQHIGVEQVLEYEQGLEQGLEQPGLGEQKQEEQVDYKEDKQNDQNIENHDCMICRERLTVNSLVRLTCFHAYHYDCILQWFITMTDKQNAKKYKARSCPFCNKISGYLPLKPGTKPIKNIHESYFGNTFFSKSDTTKKSDNLNTTKKYGYNQYCVATIKSKQSKNYGKTCGLYAYYGNYCGKHKSLVAKEEIQQSNNDTYNTVINDLLS